MSYGPSSLAQPQLPAAGVQLNPPRDHHSAAKLTRLGMHCVGMSGRLCGHSKNRGFYPGSAAPENQERFNCSMWLEGLYRSGVAPVLGTKVLWECWQ